MYKKIMRKVEKVFFSSFGLNNKCNTFGYKKQFEDKKLTLYKRSLLGKKIVATLESWAILQSPTNPNCLFIYQNINCMVYKRIILNDKAFPGLIPNSKVQQCMLIPYMRDLGNGKFVKAIRINIITDKCQVYHNYPTRSYDCDGESLFGDDVRFEESAVWDVPNHLYPSKEKMCSDVERYFPYLPENAYEYHPALNTDSSFVDRYKNGGFGKMHRSVFEDKEIYVSRFYFPKRSSECNSLYHIGGEEPTYKMTVIGTYRANNGGNGVRTVVFCSSDGGRNWFAKYEFGDVGEYKFVQGENDWRTAFGNPVDITRDYSAESKCYIRKRNVILPSEIDKEPLSKFSWGEKIPVSQLTRKKTTIVTTERPHGLQTGNIIIITNEGTIEYPFINNEVSDEDCGNDIIFKINVINDRSLEIFECVSAASNNICCRHIHQINRVKDGWLIGTGEIYPNGWLLFMQMKEADLYSVKTANEEFNFYRLNSSENSVQRTLGAILLDDSDSTLIYASDHDTLERSSIPIPGDRTMNISRNSVGIYRGRLKDIDDRNKFVVIYEAQEPAFFFKCIKGHLVFAGQIGELAISDENYKNWSSYKINTETHMYFGANTWYMVLGDYIIQMR